MLFTRALMVEMSKADRILECIDDLAVLDAKNQYPYGGRYEVNDEGVLNHYNQDHLSSWCVLARIKGNVTQTPKLFFFGGNNPKMFRHNVNKKIFGREDEGCDVADR
eukprot:UN02682